MPDVNVILLFYLVNIFGVGMFYPQINICNSFNVSCNHTDDKYTCVLRF